ncbi:MAG: hypothetical protein WEA58_08155 [Balneolaceae bacterium]
MSFWTLDISVGTFFLDFAWMGVLLAAAFIMRSRIPILQKYLIPANLLAGFLGLLVGTNGLGLLDLPTERLGSYVYHLLALLFIGLSLRTPKQEVGLSSMKFGMAFIITYLIQGILGILIALGLIYTIMPDLFAGIGFLPPLAFGMNPGIAYTIGDNWEGFGFESGGVVGLTFSAIGFLVAYTAGIWIVKRGIKNGEAAYISKDQVLSEDLKTGIHSDSNGNDSGRLTTSSEVIESLTVHIALIGLIYILTYGLVQVFETGLVYVGAENEVRTLWSFHFIVAALVALLVRKIMDMGSISQIIDDVTMTRISNLFMDFMIVASVAAISLVVVGQYWVPLLLISIVVAISTWWVIRYLTKSAFAGFKLERFAAIFGNMTGTLQSGLVLLRILDSGMKSPVSFNLVYGSGMALFLGFPLLLLINAPVHYFTDITQGFIAVMFAMIVYLGLLLLAWKYINKK